MSELVERVQQALMGALTSPTANRNGAPTNPLARAAIEAVFDWLAEPSKGAIGVGIATADDCLDHDWDSGSDGESHNSYTTLRSDAPQVIFKTMLSAMRATALPPREG